MFSHYYVAVAHMEIFHHRKKGKSKFYKMREMDDLGDCGANKCFLEFCFYKKN